MGIPETGLIEAPSPCRRDLAVDHPISLHKHRHLLELPQDRAEVTGLRKEFHQLVEVHDFGMVIRVRTWSGRRIASDARQGGRDSSSGEETTAKELRYSSIEENAEDAEARQLEHGRASSSDSWLKAEAASGRRRPGRCRSSGRSDRSRFAREAPAAVRERVFPGLLEPLSWAPAKRRVKALLPLSRLRLVLWTNASASSFAGPRFGPSFLSKYSNVGRNCITDREAVRCSS